ncbi:MULTISPECIES: response regulator [Pseudoalteromonas]|uniref:Response regulator containing a CheY-like receiver domain and a GGDEF domain protein n=1 Tax=Pseudoalteromonas luteoviolacea (strain 2ta16) TaxID=1353533 RepID=V4HCQ2_PSEL2|nr:MULTISPECIES: response regulator [Pseudoalteromonas]ESP95236.1 response regulator containing a CheY-like receiver domain and a GGDEF domain protein [Pseudoalteromonas luteoviolacea 2ta16]KZN37850.1 chemotaxis protein CheY [Pseudoalteromonas luteoviolacea NCIMB 1944]MCG7551479.1 response regulator [Pseudoalteromonas sp. Of7M-16]
MAVQPFVNSKILIVEEQPLALSYLKQSLERLAYRNIFIAESAAVAKESCEVNKFDLIICSFDLSKRQNGYQLYEELLKKRLIKRCTGFIFTSAETSPELVHSVVELQPDDFLVKPFTIKDLQSRIERVLKRKQSLKKLYTLIDDENYSKALKFINAELDSQQTSYSVMLLKLKGEMLLKLKRYEEAKQFYKSALELQKFTWAKLGLVEALIANNEDLTAQKLLKGLIEKSETRLAALDLLGRLEIKLNQFEHAQKALHEASQIAPRNLSRQKSLSTVAMINHDYECSYNAQKEIASFARYSIHDSPEVYLNAARAGIDFALATDQHEQINKITRQTQQYLNDLKKQFPHAINQTQMDVLHARLHYLKDEHKKARQLMEQLDDEPQIRSVDAALDKAKAFHELGFQHKAQALFGQIIEHCERHQSHEDPVMMRYLQQQHDERKDITMGPKELNNHAVKQFNKGELDVALEAFSQAFRVMPKNASIALNLLQCLADATGKKGITFNTNLAKKCLKVLQSADLDSEQLTRFDKLLAQMKEMGLAQ